MKDLQTQLKTAKEQHDEDAKKLAEQEKKTKELEVDLSQKKDSLFKANSDSAKARDELQKFHRDYDSLKTQHDQEVTELFENKDTLKFVQQMKHYKEEWQSNEDDESRKKVATEMASTTKNWVSMAETDKDDLGQNEDATKLQTSN
jgi:hypothetical protein